MLQPRTPRAGAANQSPAPFAVVTARAASCSGVPPETPRPPISSPAPSNSGTPPPTRSHPPWWMWSKCSCGSPPAIPAWPRSHCWSATRTPVPSTAPTAGGPAQHRTPRAWARRQALPSGSHPMVSCVCTGVAAVVRSSTGQCASTASCSSRYRSAVSGPETLTVTRIC